LTKTDILGLFTNLMSLSHLEMKASNAPSYDECFGQKMFAVQSKM